MLIVVTFVRLAMALIACMAHTPIRADLTSLAKNDPDPIFSARDPHYPFYRRPCFIETEEQYCAHEEHRRFSIAISPFGQAATSGANFHGKRYLPEKPCPPQAPDTCGPITGNRIELGDLTGRINMLALLFGNHPHNQELPTSLANADRCLFRTEYDDLPLNLVPSCQPGNPDTTKPDEACTKLNDPSLIDPTERYASLTFPLKYQKYGVRFDMAANLVRGLGMSMQAGIAHITQQVYRIRFDPFNSQIGGFIDMENDLTCQAENLCSFQQPPTSGKCANFTENVKKLLTGNFTQIAEQLNVDIDDFNETSVDEVRLNAFWRHNIEVNKLYPHAPKLICMPFVMLSGSISPGKKRCPNKLFAVPFGNDGHNAAGCTAGLNLDFISSIELAGEIGITHFFRRTVPGLRVPTSIYQKTLFPFTADALVQPGNNWHFAGKLAAYHFLGNLSFHFQYVMINHNQDTICLCTQDPAFTPQTLAKTTAWKSKVANVGFAYDISPTIALGFLWQAPLAQRNTYRSTTLLFSFNASF